MRNWKKLIIIGIIFLFMSTFIAPIDKREPISNISLNSTALGGQYMLFAVYTDTGDFERWDPSGGTFTTFTDTGTQLYIKQEPASFPPDYYEGQATWNCEDIDTLGNLSVYYRIKTTKSDTFMPRAWVRMRFYYTDATYSTIINFDETSEQDTGTVHVNATPTAGKTVSYMHLFVAICHSPPDEGQGKVEFWLYSESYYGYAPTIVNYTQIATYVAPNAPVTFSINGTNGSMAQTLLASEWGGTTTLTLPPRWEFPGLFLNATEFPYEGTYGYTYVFYNSWDINTTTSTHYFIVSVETYPKYAYLSLFNSIDGFPLPSKDFKIYLGDPDMREAINFRTFYGNWSQLKSNSVVNASLITAGWTNNASLVDNYINVTAIENGLESTFENSQAYSTITWDTLQFQCMVMQPSWIVIIYNPDFWEKDFYLQFTSDMVGYWYDISIPFVNFTTYRDVSSNMLYELGLWIENATALFSNIRVASRYDATFYNQTYNYSDTRVITQNLTPTPSWVNISTSCFETNFSVAGASMNENITISNNDTVQMGNGYYFGIWSFQNDTAGGDPSSGWYINENNEDDIYIYSFSGHIKTLRINQTDGNLAYSPFFSDQEAGEVEFWVYTTNAMQPNVFEIYDDNMAKALVFAIYLDKFYYISSSHPAGAQIPGTPVANSAQWYKIRLIFNCSTGWYLYIDGSNYSTLLDYVGTPSAMNRIVIWDYTMGAGNWAIYDAIDCNWTDGYYTNRNWINRYHQFGYYTSKVYDLGVGDEWFYENLTYAQNLTAYTNMTLQYRTSDDNSSWSSWCEPVITNISINAYQGRYFQFRANLTGTENLTSTAKLFWVNLSYQLNDEIYTINYTETATFAYNSSSYLIDYGISQLNWSLTIWNETCFYIAPFNFTLNGYDEITPQNYTFQVLSTDFYNTTYFSLYCNVSSSSAFNFSFALNLTRAYYETWNCTNYTANSYRLISEDNRQRPDNLEFNSPVETLAILDFFNNTLWIGDITYSGFIDIGLPICDATFYNYETYPVVIRIYRGLGTWLEVVVAPSSSVTVPVFCTNYRIWIANEALRELQVTWRSPNTTRTMIIEWGVAQTITFPDFWEQLFYFLFQTPLGLIVIALVVIYVFIQIYSAVRPRIIIKPKKKEENSDRWFM